MFKQSKKYSKTVNADAKICQSSFVKQCLDVLSVGGNVELIEQMLKNYFSIHAPRIFKPKPDPTDLSLDEEAVKETLLDPLTFIISGKFDLELADLSKQLNLCQNRPGRICGKVFANGEATYTCRECANDPTCVLCYECFSNSAHKSHKYKMATSGGTGYCDCGDPEAWKNDPHCCLHAPKLDTSTDDISDAPELPSDLVFRMKTVAKILLHYAVEMLCWEYSDILPKTLNIQNVDLPYVTMLFNDESHSYDDVILALSKSIGCNEEKATFLASVVDREGRSAVRSGGKEYCDKARVEIEKLSTRGNTKVPLLVETMDTNIVAHQQFSIRLLSWLTNTIQEFHPLLDVVNEIFMKEKVPCSEDTLILAVLYKDSKLWKSARLVFHQFIMGSVLMNTESKKQFSKQFLEMYPMLMNEFIKDDHEHSLSVVALSVQIFTVPTIARYLISEVDAITQVMEVILTTAKKFVDRTGKMKFQPNMTNLDFKRSLHCFSDLKYLLTTPPTGVEEWREGLQTGFENGLESFLQFMGTMHYMNESVRCTTSHQEYESEWETAFNISIRLNPVLAMIVRWCSSNNDVQRSAYHKVLHKLVECLHVTKSNLGITVCAKVFDHEAYALCCDFARHEVSIHIPVHRLFAGLYLNMAADGMLPSDDDNFPTPYRFIELPLRIFVLSAQVAAGMWRRNGFSIPNQLHNYYAPYCRSEMYDKDVLLMQIGASLMDPNDFLCHLANRFGLIEFLQCEGLPSIRIIDEIMKNNVVVFEEFLHLLIIILSERHVVNVGIGITKEDTIRREIIQVLCKGPAAFSKLDKLVPEDHSDEIALDHVIRSVADFRQPSGTMAGTFVLKTEYLQQYSPFYYHFSKSDVSKAEEYQFIQRKSSDDLHTRARPPPMLPSFCTYFEKINDILSSEVFLKMLAFIFRNWAAKSVHISESHLHRALHLVGIGINEQIRTAQTSKPIFFTREASKFDILKLIENLHTSVSTSNLHNLNDLASWTAKKFEEAAALHGSPPSSTIAVQLYPTSQNTDAESNRKAMCRQIAMKRRQKAIEQMQKLQKDFVHKNKSIFESTKADEGSDSDEYESKANPASETFPVCLGFKKTVLNKVKLPKVQCILCQENEEEVDFKSNSFIYAAFVQCSTLFSKNPMKDSENMEDFDPLYPAADCHQGIHASTCGHTMHTECWRSYYDSIILKERKRPFGARLGSYFDVNNGEYTCPLCKRLSNTVLPVVPPLLMLGHEAADVDVSFDSWLETLRALLEPVYETQKGKWCSESKQLRKRSRHSSSGVCLRKATKSRSPTPLASTDSDTESPAGSVPQSEHASFWFAFGNMLTHVLSRPVVDQVKHLFHSGHHFDENKHNFSSSNVDMVATFGRAIYMNAFKLPPFDDSPRVPIVSWLTVAFTLKSLDASLEFECKPLFGALAKRQKHCMRSLVRTAALSNILSKHTVIRGHAIRLLAPFLDFDYMGPSYPTILELDMFSVMVELTYSLNWMFLDNENSYAMPRGGVNEQHILRLCLTAYWCQLMLSFDQTATMENKIDVEMSEDSNSKFSTFIQRFYDLTGIQASCASSRVDLIAYIKRGLVSFLRPAALFFHYLTGVTPPEALHDPSIDEFVPLCRYLNLPTDIEGFVDFLAVDLIEKWTKHPRFSVLIASNGLIRQPVKPNMLVELPHDFSDLINKTTKFKCPSLITDDSRMPTICLLCGTMLCSQSYCCQKNVPGNNKPVGACTNHAQYCTAGTGVFLRIRDCRVVLMYNQTRGCYLPAPYVDEYGETDFGFRRGHPLFLNAELYRRMQLMWLNQAVPEYIANQIELNGGQLWMQEWQLM